MAGELRRLAVIHFCLNKWICLTSTSRSESIPWIQMFPHGADAVLCAGPPLAHQLDYFPGGHGLG